MGTTAPRYPHHNSSGRASPCRGPAWRAWLLEGAGSKEFEQKQQIWIGQFRGVRLVEMGCSIPHQPAIHRTDAGLQIPEGVAAVPGLPVLVARRGHLGGHYYSREPILSLPLRLRGRFTA